MSSETRWYKRNEDGQIEIRNGDWSIHDGMAYRIDCDPRTGNERIDWDYGHKLVGPVELKGWPDTKVTEYEDGILIPQQA